MWDYFQTLKNGPSAHLCVFVCVRLCYMSLAQQDSNPPCWLWPSLQAGGPVSHPPSFPLSLPPSSLDPPVPLTVWLDDAAVLDPEHGKGLYKNTIHHRWQGHMTRTPLIWYVCVISVPRQHKHNIYSREHNVKCEHAAVLIHTLFPCVMKRNCVNHVLVCVFIFLYRYYTCIMNSHTRRRHQQRDQTL